MYQSHYIIGDTIFTNVPEGIEVKKNDLSQYSLYSTKSFMKGDLLGISVAFVLPIDYNVNKIKFIDSNKLINTYDYNDYNSSINKKKGKKKVWAFDCFTNHSCFPNIIEVDDTPIQHEDGYLIEPFKIIANGDIKIGDEITTNYLTYEYDLLFPFDCNCGNVNCFKTIKGFRHLTSEQKQLLLPEIDKKTIEDFKLEELNYEN